MQVTKFDTNSLRSICNIMGDTDEGLTGSEISQLLNQLNIQDPEPYMKNEIVYLKHYH